MESCITIARALVHRTPASCCAPGGRAPLGAAQRGSEDTSNWLQLTRQLLELCHYTRSATVRLPFDAAQDQALATSQDGPSINLQQPGRADRGRTSVSALASAAPQVVPASSMGSAVSSQGEQHAHSTAAKDSRRRISLSALLNQLHAAPMILDQALAVGYYTSAPSTSSSTPNRSELALDGTEGSDGTQTDSSAPTSREGSLHQPEGSCSSAASSATNSPEARSGMSRRAGRDLGDETADETSRLEISRAYGEEEEEDSGMGLMMDMGLEQRPQFVAAAQEEATPKDDQVGPSPPSASNNAVEVQRWFVIDEQPCSLSAESTSSPPASSSGPSLHPFDPTFSPPSPLCGSSSSSPSISAVSSPSTSSGLSSSRPPPTPPSPSPPRHLPQLPEGCVLIPFIAEEDTEEEDAEYWTRLPTFEQGPGSPSWSWHNEPAPDAPPSPRARSLSLPLPLKERPTAPTRARSSPNSSTLLGAGLSANSRGRSSSPSSRGRNFSPCASSSTSRQRSPSPPKEPSPPATRRTRSGRPRRPKPPIVVDPWAPASPPEEKKQYMRSLGSALESSSSESSSEEEDSEQERTDDEDEDHSHSDEDDEDDRFVDLAQLRRIHYLSLSLQAPPSSSASSSRSSSPDGTPARRRQKRGTTFFGAQYHLYAMGTANLRRTGEGYWRDVGRGGSWVDLE